MNWHTKYAIIINIDKQTLDFTSQRQRYQIVVEFSQTSTINNIEYYSVIRVVEESEEDSKDQAEWLPALLLAYNNKIVISVAEEEYKELIECLLKKYSQIVFVDEKNVTMID